MVAVPVDAELVERSADPSRVRAGLDRIARAEGSDGPSLAVADAPALVAVLAASRDLTELLVSDPRARELLGNLEVRPPVPDDPAGLGPWARRELLRIAARDLALRATLAETTAALSDRAVDLLRVAHASTGVEEPLAVVAMGKLGGGELNYASDVDLLFVGEGDPDRLERAARRLLAVAGRCVRVDVDLRPEGRDGPLVRSLASYQAYWQRWADPWERQALLRARPVAGDDELGRGWQAAADEVVWGRPFTADELRYVRAMKARAEEVVRQRGIADREVKRGPGGIRDIEFAAQLLQLVHGHVDDELRTRDTVTALTALDAGGYVDHDDALALADAYVFLRRVEHVLQLDEGRQTHTVPAERPSRRRLARVLGYQGDPRGGPTELFDADLAAHRGRVRLVHERIWFRPLLESLSGAGPLGPEAAAERLAAFGFADVDRTRQAVVELTRGLTRSSRMMQQLLPLLLDWLSTSPDPDLGLLGLRRLASGERRAGTLAIAFRDSPEVARQLALLLGTSRFLGEVLLANPDLVERLAVADRLRTRPRPELIASAQRAIGWRRDPDERQRALRRWHQRNLLGIAARDVFDLAPVETIGGDLTALAEGSLEAALASLEPQVPLAVVAFGRFGGAELGYASDLDVAFVFDDGGSPATAEEADRVASGLLRFVGGGTPAERIWTIDAGLRPEGRNGPLARSLGGWRAYLSRWASTWERQAYLRLRPVAGDAELAGRLAAEVQDASWSRPFTEDDAREVRRMKVRIEQERIGRGEDPEFHLKLGRGSLSDIEFTVQLLQLQHRVPGASTISTLHALVEAGHLPVEDAEILEESYRFCEHTRNRSFLVVGAGDSLPIRPEQITPLARSLGFTVPGLREEYRRLTRRARRVVERRFYGQG